MSVPTEQLETPDASQKGKSQFSSFRRVLRNRYFLRLWLAQLISLTVLNAANYGVIVLVNNITHSVFMVGVAIIAFTLPGVPFSAAAGAIVDHLDKRVVLWVSNLLRMVATFLLVVSLLIDPSNLWPLYVLAFMTSLIGQFFMPAEGSSIPLLVGERELMPALSLFNISFTVSQALGFLLLGRVLTAIFPSFTFQLGSLRLAVQPIDMLFVVIAFSYLVCTVLIFSIPASAFKEAHIHNDGVKRTHIRIGEALKTLWADMVEAWCIVRSDRLLFFSVIQVSAIAIVMLLIGEIAGTFVQTVLHRPAADMSLILAPAAVGLVGASVLMPRITRRVGKVRLTLIGLIVLAAGFILLPVAEWLTVYLDPKQGTAAPQLLWTILILVFLLGAAMACVNVPTQTMMQERAPEESRARVLALQFTIYNAGSIPILLFAGAFAQLLGFNQLILLLSASLLLFCWWGAGYVKGFK
jgi:MFS family permease